MKNYLVLSLLLVNTKTDLLLYVTEIASQVISGEISSERDGTKKMMKNLNIIQISHLTFECS